MLCVVYIFHVLVLSISILLLYNVLYIEIEQSSIQNKHKRRVHGTRGLAFPVLLHTVVRICIYLFYLLLHPFGVHSTC